MQAKEIMMFVLAFSLALTSVNQIGLFDINGQDRLSEIDTGADVDAVLNNSLDGVQEIDSELMSDDDAADSISGTSMLWQSLSTIKTMLTLTAFPGPYLKDLGVPGYIWLPVQVIINATVIWGLIQFVSGRFTKGID